jgi:hypothetical protein
MLEAFHIYSRWLSGATPPEIEYHNPRTPAGVPEVWKLISVQITLQVNFFISNAVEYIHTFKIL